MKSSLFNHSPLRIKGKQTFQIVPRAKDSSTGVKGNIKEKILNKVRSTINNRASVFGYGSDILSALTEINVDPKRYLELCIHCLTKQTRNFSDIQLINGYLFFMNEFINLIKKQDESHLNDYLQIISMYMGYERYEKNQIICKYGDKGRKAYIVLQGKMDILIKQNRKMRIIEHDYINYIAALLRYQEYGLLSLVLKENYEEYPLEIIDPNKKTKEDDGDNTDKERENVQNGTTYFTWKASECKKKEEVIQLTPMQLLQMIEPKYKELSKHKDKEIINSVSSDEYIARINNYTEITPQNEFHPKYRGKKILTLTIYSYLKIITKQAGSLIGEIALSDPMALRSASMITSDVCHLGTINKQSYNLSLKSCAEKQRRQNLFFIQSFQLFSSIPIFILGKRYFNNFIFSKIEKGCTLMKENKPDESIYLLKEGEFEVSLNGSLNDLNELKYLMNHKKCQLQHKKYIQNSEKKQKELMYFDNLMRDNPQFKKEFYTKRRIIIGAISAPDIIGLSEYKYNEDDKCIFSVECKSSKGEMYQLSLQFYNEMQKNDSSMREKEASIIKKRLEKMEDRISLILKSKIESFYDYKSKRRKFQLDMELQEDFEKRCLSSKGKIESKKYFIKNLNLAQGKETCKVDTNPTTSTEPVVTVSSRFSSSKKESPHHKKNRSNHSFKKSLNFTNTHKKHNSLSINTFQCNTITSTPKIMNLKRSRNYMKTPRSSKADSIFSNIYLKTITSAPKVDNTPKSPTCLLMGKTSYSGRRVCVISPLRTTAMSSSPTRQTNTSSFSFSKSPKREHQIYDTLQPKENYVEIESYVNYKKERYLKERKRYIANQMKKYEIKMQKYIHNRKISSSKE